MAKKTFVGSTAEALKWGLYKTYGLGEATVGVMADLVDGGFDFSQGIADTLSGVPMSRVGDRLWSCGVRALKETKDVARRIIDATVRNLR